MHISCHIWVAFIYGGHTISYSKAMAMPAPPFYDMVIDDSNESTDNRIDLLNNDYVTTIIDYNRATGYYEVHVRNFWNLPVTADTVNDVIDTFESTNWIRRDSTNENELIALMKSDHDKNN